MKKLLGNLALSLAVSLGFLLLLEGGARLVEKRRPPRPEVERYIWNWDDKMPGGFYVMESDAAGWPPWEKFNADGLRDRTRSREKPELVRRVAVLGDSVTLGDGIEPEQAYPQLLEAAAAAEGRPLEVMNVALWGWSTRQERIAWQRIARSYQPDAAILAVCLNDIPELFNNLSRPPRWLSDLHDRSALVRLVIDAEGREIDSVERLFSDVETERVRRALDGFFAEVRALREDVERDGASFALVVFPFRFQVEKGAPAPVVQERILSFCAQESLRCLDLLPTMAAAGPDAFSDYDHLSPEGAVRVARAIEASGLLPATEPARETLRRSGFGADERSLLAALAAAEPQTRRAAAWAAGATGASGALGEALARALREDASAGVRAAAARAAGELGKDARALVPPLLDALADPSEAVRHEAARALARVPLEAGAAPRLVEALASADDYVAAFAAWSLGNLGPAAGEQAAAALTRALARERTDAVVAGAIARLGPAAAGAVPVLTEALHGAEEKGRWRAARALGRIGPAAEDAVPALAAALGDTGNTLLRLHAARALGRIGPGARPAAAALQRATGDPDPGVREEARRALERLH